MPSIGGYHPYGLASILTGLESIEHVWDILGRRIAVRQPPPICLPELRRAFTLHFSTSETYVAHLAQTKNVTLAKKKRISRIIDDKLRGLVPCPSDDDDTLVGILLSLLQRYSSKETGSASRRPGQCRRRATTPNEDRYLVLTARRHRNKNAIHLQQYLRSATGNTVSTQTVRNQVHGVGLYARRPKVCVGLTSRHRRDCREWAKEHVNWRRNEWSNVLFSDESRFSVHPDNRRIFIWRDRGSRSNPAFVHESVRFGSGGVLVYGGISIDGCTGLYINRDGPLTARRYRDEILRPIVVPYAAAIGDDFILMDDNCRPHRANLVEDFLFEEGIVRMEWPACSPDMNPIEHVWDALGRRLAGRQPHPQTLQELEEWDRIPQLVTNSLIYSMPQMCSTLLDVRGNHTPY
ncbi:transposable element Tcb2 transposase [Trichonephila clavipes]|nr:transposable element Tcb2 transposase [Trichonephila clavipes]